MSVFRGPDGPCEIKRNNASDICERVYSADGKTALTYACTLQPTILMFKCSSMNRNASAMLSSFCDASIVSLRAERNYQQSPPEIVQGDEKHKVSDGTRWTHSAV